VGQIVVAVDGCSAPVFGVSLRAMALSYARLVDPAGSTPRRQAARRILAAMLEFPEMVGGTRHRLDTDLMRALPGRIVSKVGAEGVQLIGVLPTAAYPRGLGVAIKIEDGDIRRARDPVVIEVLRQLGVLDEEALSPLQDYRQATLRNHRHLAVGEVRTAFNLFGGSPQN
ncbi:MAG: asparaginase, partial [Acidobacteriota bacterium]